jgi:hypothetical protein
MLEAKSVILLQEDNCRQHYFAFESPISGQIFWELIYAKLFLMFKNSTRMTQIKRIKIIFNIIVI